PSHDYRKPHLPATLRRYHMLDSATYLAAFHREAAALAVAAQRGLDAPVPSCPGWTVATLLTHLTGLYAESVKLVEGRPNEPNVLVKSYDDLGLPIEFKDWFEAEKEDFGALPPGLPELFETTVADLELVARRPERPLPTTAPGAGTGHPSMGRPTGAWLPRAS